MLPDLDLDSERYDDIYENARNLIVSVYPEWTDFNYHDPGVTMLEMFSWLRESQQYYLNKIGPENIRTYLKLLGISARTKKPSRTSVTVTSDEDTVAAKGTRLYAGDICFEADERTYISSSRLVCCVTVDGEKYRLVQQGEMNYGSNMRISPFPNKTSGAFALGFSKPLKENERHHIYFEIENRGRVKRNPITDPDSFIPLVDIKLEYYSAEGWREIPYEDGTFGFLNSGMISFVPDGELAPKKTYDSYLYCIRFSITGGEYDDMPLIHHISFNQLPVTQRDTKAEYTDIPAGGEYKLHTELALTGDTRVFLKGRDGLFTPVGSFGRIVDPDGVVHYDIPGAEDAVSVRIVNIRREFLMSSAVGNGTGLPFQEYDLGTRNIEYESFTIMTEYPDSGGRYVEWRKVSDFSASMAGDHVYVLDSGRGIIRFGNCLKGEAPEGRIFIIGFSETLAADGNVSRGKITSADDAGGVTVTNHLPSTGGTNEETVDDCLVRAQMLMNTTGTVVTDADCERFILGVQGLRIERCQVIGRSEGGSPLVTNVVVKPYSRDGRGVPGERYIKNILAALEPRRMLGMQYNIVRPEYSGVTVYIDVAVSDRSSNPRRQIREAVVRFFGEVKDRFGAVIVYTRLYELIDALECVKAVNSITLETDGIGLEYRSEGDIVTQPNVAVYLVDTEITVVS